MLLSVYCEWKEEFRSYKGRDNSFKDGPLYPPDMLSYLATIQPPDHLRPDRFIRDVAGEEHRIDLGAPLSVSRRASCFCDCDALGISRGKSVLGRISQRLFSFEETTYKPLVVGPAFFASSEGKIVTFSRDIIERDTITSLLGFATLR